MCILVRSCEAGQGLKLQIFISDEITATPITFAQLPLARANKDEFEFKKSNSLTRDVRKAGWCVSSSVVFIFQRCKTSLRVWVKVRGRARVKALRGRCVFSLLFIVKRERELFFFFFPFPFKWEHSFSPPVAKP